MEGHRRRSRAMFTWMALPSIAVPLRALMAASASDWVGISTKPNPRGSPVILSVISLTLETSPKAAKWSISLSSVIIKGRLPGVAHVKNDVERGARMGGTPARPFKEWARKVAAIKRLGQRPQDRDAH